MCVSYSRNATHISLSLSLPLYGWTYTRGQACVGHFYKLPFRVPALYKDDMFFLIHSCKPRRWHLAGKSTATATTTTTTTGLKGQAGI